MSTRQLVRSAKEGRKVGVGFASGDYLEGYVVGLDDYSLLIACEDRLVIIGKGQACVISLYPASTWDQESQLFQTTFNPVRSSFLHKEEQS